MNTKLPATLRAGLVAIINLLDGRDTSRGTAVTTRPLPMWQPERLIERIERETVFVVAPVPQPAQPQPEPKQKPLVHYTRQWRYGYESGGMYWLNPDNRPAAPSAVNEIYEAAKDGRLVIIDMIPNVPWLPHERELWQMNEAAKHGHVAPAQMSNGSGPYSLDEVQQCKAIITNGNLDTLPSPQRELCVMYVGANNGQ